MRESVFSALECELIDRRRFATKAAARIAAFPFIEGFRDPSRRRSSIGCLSPSAFEEAGRPADATTLAT